MWSQLGSGRGAGHVSARQQPGKSLSLSMSNCQGGAVSLGVSQGVHSGVPGQRGGSGTHRFAACFRALGTASVLTAFFASFQKLLARCDPAGSSYPSQGPMGAWAPAASQSGSVGLVVPSLAPSASTISAGGSSKVEPDSQGHWQTAPGTGAVASSIASVTSASQTEMAGGGSEPHKANEFMRIG